MRRKSCWRSALLQLLRSVGIRYQVAFVFLCFALGCASAPPSCKVPGRVELEVEASDTVNLDDEGRALPTHLRLYQLSDLHALRTASFDDLWYRADEALGPAVVEPVVARVLYPGQIIVEQMDRNDAADYLVAVAGFRKPVGTAWQTVNEWPLAGDPCAERNDERAAPQLEQLRVRMFLRDYQIVSTNQYARLLPRRSCPGGAEQCDPGRISDELPVALEGRRLRTFEEDPGPARATQGGREQGAQP